MIPEMKWMNIVEYFCKAVHTMPEAAFCFKVLATTYLLFAKSVK